MKDKIKELVETYIQNNQADYLAVCEHVVQERKKLADQKFGEGGTYYALHTTPEILHGMIITALTPEERQEWQSLDNRKWFATEFPEFRLPDEV